MFLRFLDLLFPPRASERLVRSLEPRGFADLLDPKARVLDGIEVTALLPYDAEAVRACIVEAKYHANDRAAKALGSALAAYVGEELADRDAYERRRYALVPVPLSSARLRERGHNQAETVARHAARRMPEIAECAVETGLIARLRDTLPQTTLDRQERLRNVRGAFGAAHPADPHVTYILLDDVITTGATLADAARALRQAGAHDIWIVALAG